MTDVLVSQQERVSAEDIITCLSHKDLHISRQYLRVKQYSPDAIEMGLKAVYKAAYEEPEQTKQQVVKLSKHLTGDPYKGLFICTAYLLGASLSQLALLTNIQRATVYDHVRRRYPDVPARNAMRRQHKLPFETVQVIQSHFYMLLRGDDNLARKWQPERFAQALEKEINFMEAD